MALLDPTGIGSLAGMISEIIRAWRLIESAFNSPEMVQQKQADLHQQYRDKVNAAEAVIKDPKSTPEQKAAAVNSLRLIES